MTAARTHVLTGSPENLAVTRERDFRVIGLKEGRRRMAEGIEPGDRFILYVTRLQAFAAIVRAVGAMYEDRSPVWPGKPGKEEAYPWRFETEPVLALEDESLLPAVDVVAELEHARKWPAEHWQLAFQGQLRPISAADAELLERRMRRLASTSAPV